MFGNRYTASALMLVAGCLVIMLDRAWEPGPISFLSARSLTGLRGTGPGAATTYDVTCSVNAARSIGGGNDDGVDFGGCSGAPAGTPCADCTSGNTGKKVPEDDLGTQTNGWVSQSSSPCGTGQWGTCDSFGSCFPTGSGFCPDVKQFLQQAGPPGGGN